MEGFDSWMTQRQVNWRARNVSTAEAGVQNKVTAAWLLPRWAWQEGLWPPLRGGGHDSLAHHLVTHRVRSHSGCHNLKSSWVSGVNLYFPFGRTDTGRSLLAGFLARHVDARVRSVESLELEWSGDPGLSARVLLGESGPAGGGRTTPDLALRVNRGEGLLLVENKLTEHSFYPCAARTGSGSATRPGLLDTRLCDDCAALLRDPGRCHHQTLGRQYWRWLSEPALAGEFGRLPRCPAATAGSQLFRQQALAEALASSGRYGFVTSVLALDDRNEALSRCLSATGLADVRDWLRVFRGRSSFAVFTHQQWACWVGAHGADGELASWADWISGRYGIPD
jgi:hypothetical protein